MKKRYTLKVGAKNYTLHVSKRKWKRLREDYTEAHESAGRTDASVLQMWIDPDLPSDQRLDTLVHEIMHALWEDTGATQVALTADEDADGEEKFIRLMSPRLTAFLVENKAFVAELLGLPAPRPSQAEMDARTAF